MADKLAISGGPIVAEAAMMGLGAARSNGSVRMMWFMMRGMQTQTDRPEKSGQATEKSGS